MEKLKDLLLPGEQWKIIEGTEEKYAVSDHGRIASFWKSKPIILRPHPCSNGYLKVVFYLPIGEKTIMPHRMVAKYFVDNPDGKLEVNHKDGVKLNNKATNLEWATRTENVRHQVDNGLFKGFEKGHKVANRHRGERSPTAVLTEPQVRAIRADRAEGLKYKEIAEKHSIKISLVGTALHYWKHVK